MSFSSGERRAALQVQAGLVQWLKENGAAKWRIEVETEALQIMLDEERTVALAESYIAAANEE